VRGPVLAAFVAVALAVTLLVGGFVEVGVRSGPAGRMLARGFAALAAPVVAESNATGAALATTMGRAVAGAPSPDRTALQLALDQAVRQSAAEAASMGSFSRPQPPGDGAALMATAFDERATAVRRLRDTIDGLLGMAPLPVPGSAAHPSDGTVPPALSAAAASDQLSAEGALLATADRAYAQAVRALRRTSIAVALPSSRWVSDRPGAVSPLGAGGLGASASALVASPVLAPVTEVIISATGLTPPALADGGPGVVGDGCSSPTSAVASTPSTVLPPTSTVTATVTVTDCGSTFEPHVVVTATLVGQGAKPVSQQRSSAPFALEPGASVSVTLPTLPVAPGSSYMLSFAIPMPSGQSTPAGTTQSFSIDVSPSS